MKPVETNKATPRRNTTATARPVRKHPLLFIPSYRHHDRHICEYPLNPPNLRREQQSKLMILTNVPIGKYHKLPTSQAGNIPVTNLSANRGSEEHTPELQP